MPASNGIVAPVLYAKNGRRSSKVQLEKELNPNYILYTYYKSMLSWL